MSGLFLDNYGDISGGRGSYNYRSNGGIGGSAVQLAADDSLENKGIISGGPGGTGATGALSTEHHNTSGGSGGVGVRLASGDNINNSGTIIGGEGGTGGTSGDGFGTGGPGGPGGIGVYAPTETNITNSGLIIGGTGGSAGYGFTPGPSGIDGLGVDVNSGDLTNSGTVFGEVFLTGDGMVSDSGLISGDSNHAGVSLQSGTLIVSGTLSGGSGKYAVFSAPTPGVSSTIVLYPQAVVSGSVRGFVTHQGYEIGYTDLVLASTSSIGTLSGLDSKFIGISGIEISYGASWVIEENATYLNFGLNYEPVTTSPGIRDFAPTDTFIVDGFQEETYSYSSNLSSLELANGSGLLEQIELSGANDIYPMGALSTSDFIVETGGGNTTISLNPVAPCFLNGTKIDTPRGKIAVEKLRIGDLVETTQGPRPIRWIGTRGYGGSFIAGNPAVLPIRIRRHAIALNVPSRDLYVSPEHAICEGGVFIHAHLLINGRSITQLKKADSVEYFHIELDNHAIIFAENLATESFIDEDSRHRFANAHTAPPAVPQKPCLPRVSEGFHLHNIKSRIAHRAGVREPVTLGALRGCIDESTPTVLRGWAQDSANPESPVLLEISSGGSSIVGGKEFYSTRVLANTFRPDLRAAGVGSGCHAFTIILPNLQGPITIRRVADGAILQRPAHKRCA